MASPLVNIWPFTTICACAKGKQSAYALATSPQKRMGETTEASKVDRPGQTRNRERRPGGPAPRAFGRRTRGERKAALSSLPRFIWVGPGEEQLMRGKLRENSNGVLGGRDRDPISATCSLAVANGRRPVSPRCDLSLAMTADVPMNTDNGAALAKVPLYAGSTQYRYWRFSPEQLADMRAALNTAAVAAIRDAFELDSAGRVRSQCSLRALSNHPHSPDPRRKSRFSTPMKSAFWSSCMWARSRNYAVIFASPKKSKPPPWPTSRDST